MVSALWRQLNRFYARSFAQKKASLSGWLFLTHKIFTMKTDIVNHSRRARNSDPVTSHLAAAKVYQFAATHCGDILRTLTANGPLTVDQIAAASGLPSQAVNKRLPELQRLGAAVPLDGITRPSNSGRQARVWSAL